MGIFRRRSARAAADPRTAGMAAGLGIDTGEAVVDRAEASLGLHCGTCGAPGRIDMIDMTVRRAYLTCRRCGRIWDTDRAALPAQPFFSRTQ